MVTDDIKTLHELPKKSYLDYIKLFPITQTPQIRDYTTLFLTLVAVIIFSIFAISPTISTILELRKTLADNEFANAALEEKLVALDRLQNQYNDFGETLERINNAIPIEPDIPILFARIQTLAEENDVTVTDLRSTQVPLDQNPEGNVPTSFTFSLTISASYENTLAFLSSLTTFDRILTLEEITIERAAETTAPLTTVITGKAYFHPEMRQE